MFLNKIYHIVVVVAVVVVVAAAVVVDDDAAVCGEILIHCVPIALACLT